MDANARLADLEGKVKEKTIKEIVVKEVVKEVKIIMELILTAAPGPSQPQPQPQPQSQSQP